jgi:hypothetical protein
MEERFVEGIVPMRSSAPLIARPIVSVTEAIEAWKEFQTLKKGLLDEDDYCIIGEKKRDFIKKSGWLKLATPFGLTDEVLQEEREDREDAFVYRFTVRVTAPSGRSVVAVGACSSAERRFAHPEHDVRATAHTRAKARGIADMVGGGGAIGEDVEANVEYREELARDALDETVISNWPERIKCTQCGNEVLRRKSQMSGKYYLICEKCAPHFRMMPDGAPYDQRYG